MSEHIEPMGEQLAALAALGERYQGPVEMLNLLRFGEQAHYREGSGHTPSSGREAYARYGAAVQAHLSRVGAQVIYAAAPQLMVIGPTDKHWDEVLIVRYPGVAAFLAMVSDPEYQKIAVHRSAALADSRLVAMRPAH
jgi:uncharacterized protein (DUF1330 family)